jgi:hypothetical protein
MYAGKAGIKNGVVPAGDRGEQLVANLILSLIASELHANATARSYVAQAHALALDLAVQSSIYRPPRASKFACLTCELDGEIQDILLPVINDILVVPAIATGGLSGDHRDYPDAANVRDLEIVHFMLRLRPRRLAIVLESLKGIVSSQHLADAARRILRACMHRELPAGEPLDRVGECFGLARNLIGSRNFPLAALALNNADRALDSYLKVNSIKDHPEIVQSMKGQIKELLRELKQTAM